MTAKQVKMSYYMNWRREKEKLPATLAYFTILICIWYIAFVLHVLAFTTGCVIAC